MKKLITLMSTTFCSLIIQQCTERHLDFEEVEIETATSIVKKGDSKNSAKDSAGSGSEIVIVKDPPVRDGDDWRQSSTK
ncbi:hypothetical protein ACFQO9_01475 [Chryseobacterium zhengzhouense]|jgi:hypothetical protein|uniref:Uncharacterized protein n=1 Tax=Chryseobacterium zhengzhouense TaxID=1636086 RepID=A0ABW2LU65_9FLAO|nr:hypothetical protein [Chryseobacterium sp. S0630]MCP1299192.1 hypothetical protein [Chryseobacterium sp. S0630]